MDKLGQFFHIKKFIIKRNLCSFVAKKHEH